MLYVGRGSTLGLFFVCALLLTGCAKIHVDCPTDGTIMSVGIGGNQVGTQAIALGVSAAHIAGFAVKAPGAAPSVGTTVDYSYVPIFGPDYVTCGAQSAPTPTIIVTPPGPPTPQILH